MQSSAPIFTEPDGLFDRQLMALRDAALAIASDLSLEQTLKRIVAAAASLAQARYAALGVPDESGEYLAEFVTHGMTPEAEARLSHRPRGHGLLGVILHEGLSLRLRDLHAHPSAAGFPAHHPEMTSFLGVPIIHKNRCLGNLYLTDKLNAEEFSAADQYLIELLAVHAGASIEHAHLYRQVQQLRVLEERQRIGMDLHDGVIQSIYAVGLTLEYVGALLADGDVAGARARLPSATEGLNNTIRDIRSYILELRPRRFVGDDLIAGLQQLLAEFRANTLLAVEFEADAGVNRFLSSEARLAIFHIAQEALSNAARHSHATRVSVHLLERPERVEFLLADNGHGFEPTHTDRHVGHGLLNMRERAQAAGGDLMLDSTPHVGTRITMWCPKQPAT